MSKRFGRNQKRALRAEIATLSGMVSSAKVSEQRLRERMAENQRTVELVGYVLGEHFAALPPINVLVSKLDNPMFMPGAQAMARMFDEALPGATSVMHSQLIMLLKLESCRRDELMRRTHMRFVTPAGLVAYGISEKAYRDMPDRWFAEQLPQMIAEEVAVEILKIRNQGVLRGR